MKNKVKTGKKKHRSPIVKTRKRYHVPDDLKKVNTARGISSRKNSLKKKLLPLKDSIAFLDIKKVTKFPNILGKNSETKNQAIKSTHTIYFRL